jgi:hypothetical protein
LCGSALSDPDAHVFACVKMNQAPKPVSIGYKISDANVVAEDGKAIRTARIEWKGPVSLSARDLLQEPIPGVRGPQPEKREAAKSLLLAVLRDGQPHKQKDIIAAGEKQDIKYRTLKAAADDLGVQCKKDGFLGGWVWWLDQVPEDQDPLRPSENSAYSGNSNKNHNEYRDFLEVADPENNPASSGRNSASSGNPASSRNSASSPNLQSSLDTTASSNNPLGEKHFINLDSEDAELLGSHAQERDDNGDDFEEDL